MKPYLVLGEYHPQVLPADRWNRTSGWRAWKVGEDLCAMTAGHGLVPLYDPMHPAQDWTPWYDLKLHAEVKKWTPEHPGGEAWHYDGDTTPGAKSDCALVLWSSIMPTEIQWNQGGKIYQPKAFELVIIHNLHVIHRRPPGCPKNRFMFRQRVEIPKHISLP